MGAIGQLATELDVPERTLRRAVELGAIRGRRLSERRLQLADGEVHYLHGHWQLVAGLRRALRNEPQVRLAILYGSMARGDDDAFSDVDLLVEFADEAPLDHLRLSTRLQERIGRAVDVASLRRAEHNDPFFLLQAVDEGRVVVDRDNRWHDVRSRRPALYKRAMRSYTRQQERAAAAVRKLTQER